MALLTLGLIALASLLLTHFVGFLFLRACTRLAEEECWGLAGVTGCAILAHIALLLFLAGSFHRWLYLGLAADVMVLCGAAAWVRGVRLWPIHPPPWIPALAAVWLAAVCFHLILPIYSGAYWRADWWMHFDLTQVYQGHRAADVVYFGKYTVPSRPPLYNLVEAWYLAAFGNNFAIYQVTSAVPGLAFLGCFFLLTRSISPWLCALLVAFNPFLVHNLVPWPKMFAGGCVLAALYAYTQWRDTEGPPSPGCVAAWSAFIAMAILAHTSSVIYAVAMAADHLWLRRRSLRPAVPRLAVAALLIAVLLAPWCLWVARTFGPLSLVHASPTITAARSEASSPGPGWWAQRAVNAAGSLLPLSLYDAVVAGTRTGIWDAWLRFFYSTLAGTLTLTLSVCLLVRLIRGGRSPSWGLAGSLAGLLTVGGFVGVVLLAPGSVRGGLVQDGMTPLVMILLIPAAHMVAAMGLTGRRLVLLGVLIEFLATRGAHTVLQALQVLDEDWYNLTLRDFNKIVYARSFIGSTWVLAALVSILTALTILYKGMTAESPGTGNGGIAQRGPRHRAG